MNVLQLAAPGADGVGLAIRGLGHLLACAVAVAVGAGASGRRLDPTRVLAGGFLVAVAFPAVTVVGLRTGLLAPVVGLTGNVAGTYALVASALVLGVVARFDSATSPRWQRLERAARSGGRGGSLRDTAVGVFVGSVALLAGEAATLTIVGAL